MAVYELNNGEVVIKVQSKGAELRSLKKLSTGKEYLWQADPAFWEWTSPILFPFVGGLKNREYTTKGKTYSMTQHGFARDMEFELVSQTEDEIWFVLKDTEETREKYPYEFVLKLGYKLISTGVEVCWQVENPGSEELPFSIGGHPGFYCPIEEGEKQTDCFIGFDAEEKIVCTGISEKGLATDERNVYELEEGCLQVTEHLFDNDALVVEHDQVKKVSLCGADKTAYVTVKIDAPLFGVWSPAKKNAPFICIEPWYGRCDHEGFSGELKEREWENILEPGKEWKASYQIII